MALLKGNKVVHFIPRHDIEGMPMESIMDNLKAAFDANC
jgi:putative YphP/YqiW family bacilliredoxin